MSLQTHGDRPPAASMQTHCKPTKCACMHASRCRRPSTRWALWSPTLLPGEWQQPVLTAMIAPAQWLSLGSSGVPALGGTMKCCSSSLLPMLATSRAQAAAQHTACGACCSQPPPGAGNPALPCCRCCSYDHITSAIGAATIGALGAPPPPDGKLAALHVGPGTPLPRGL